MANMPFFEDREPVDTRLSSLRSFLDMLERAGLTPSFLAEAPRTTARPTPSRRPRSNRLNAELFPSDPTISASELFDAVNRVVATDGTNTDATVAIAPELMNFARSFVVRHDLVSKHQLAANLKNGKCKRRGRNCPKGR